MSFRHALVVLMALVLTAPALAQTTMSGEGTPIVPIATEEDYARAVEQAVSGYIIPAYSDLDAATEMLGSALSAFCATPDPTSESRVRDAFNETVRAWAAVDFLRFGPMAQEGRYERFAFFPDVHGIGARQIRGFLVSEDKGLLKPGALAGKSAAVQGLPALESLLFSGSGALIQLAAPEPFRCALAIAVSENMLAITKDVLAGWEGEDGWAALMTKPGDENPAYRTHAETMTEMVKGLVTGLEQDRDHGLLPALGKTPEDAKASRAPYHASGQAIPYLMASADALARFLTASGLLQMLPADQKSYGDSALFEFANLKTALAGAGTDLRVALADLGTRSKLSYATIVLASLRDIVERHIAVAAGLTSGFNSLDGD
jgi:predicted lipoprotein